MHEWKTIDEVLRRGSNTLNFEMHDQEETKIKLEKLPKVQPGMDVSMTTAFAVYFGAFYHFSVHKSSRASRRLLWTTLGGLHFESVNLTPTHKSSIFLGHVNNS